MYQTTCDNDLLAFYNLSLFSFFLFIIIFFIIQLVNNISTIHMYFFSIVFIIDNSYCLYLFQPTCRFCLQILIFLPPLHYVFTKHAPVTRHGKYFKYSIKCYRLALFYSACCQPFHRPVIVL